MNMLDVLTSETVMTLAVTLLGGAWSLVKASAWFRTLKERRYKKALLALEAAVEEVYREYVRALKEAGDGLTPEEQEFARKYARTRAIEMARAQGVDLVQELGVDFINLWISRLVKKLKAA